jgi:hypothetical protein
VTPSHGSPRLIRIAIWTSLVPLLIHGSALKPSLMLLATAAKTQHASPTKLLPQHSNARTHTNAVPSAPGRLQHLPNALTGISPSVLGAGDLQFGVNHIEFIPMRELLVLEGIDQSGIGSSFD